MTSVGVVPTPAVAYLTRTHGYDAGVVISASHNPFEDNGIKVFSGKGEKFTERVEREVEDIIADRSWEAHEGEPAHVPHADLVGAYLDHLRAVLHDFAMHARSLGATAEHVANIDELEAAMQRARASTRSYLISIDTDPARPTEEGGWWWEVAVPEVSSREAVRSARSTYEHEITARSKRTKE